MEPQYKTPAAEEHALFNDTLLELEGWLKSVTGLTIGPKNAPIPNPDPNAERASYDGEKLRGYLESMFDPLMDHVRSLLFQRGTVGSVMNVPYSCTTKSSILMRRRSNRAG